MFPKELQNKLDARKAENNYRKLLPYQGGIDFYSNDYLGLSINEELLKLIIEPISSLGSGGSRLMSGTTKRMLDVEIQLSKMYSAGSATIFSSGFLANLGLFSCLGSRNDTIIYDQYIHASSREGIRLSMAKSFSFQHNDYEDLEKKLKNAQGLVFVAIEGIYSMHGDIPNREAILELQKKYGFQLIVDEAHSVGILGNTGKGWAENLSEDQVFARVITFGKALGYHGAMILGNEKLKDYLVNFSKPFIYTTALPESDFDIIFKIHKYTFENYQDLKNPLKENIDFYNELNQENGISPIKIVENKALEKIEEELTNAGIQTKVIKSPTVEKGKEIIRICLHNYNSKVEIQQLTNILQND